MKNNYQAEYFAKTFHGLEDVLCEELIAIGAKNVTKHIRGVSFTGNDEILYKANYYTRTSLCFLKKLFSFNATDIETLYQRIYKFPWESIFDLNRTFAIQATVNSKYFSHSKYAALKTKDAIADHFRKIYNKRPNVDVQEPEIVINVHIRDSICDISLNSSGEPLFKRGYRADQFNAPINEVLAAGMILLSGWDRRSTLFDPMCGSGTILIEAAMIALNIPPGYFRKMYSFRNWKDFDESLYKKTIQSDNIFYSDKIEIIGNDVSKMAINTARNNISKAGLLKTIKLLNNDFFELGSLNIENGIIITNPPYGKRIDNENIEELYKKIGDQLKKKYAGFSAWIISSNLHALKLVGLKPEKKYSLYNGPLECKYNKYSIYQGSLKKTVI